MYCFCSHVVWEFTDDASLAHAKAERSSHLLHMHETHELHAQEAYWTEVQVTSDNNVDQLTGGRWLPFPADATLLSRKLPRKIEPVNLNLEWTLVGLPVVNKKVVAQLYDRTDCNMTLRQFSRAALLQHERLKKSRIEINTGGSASKSSFTLDQSDKEMETNFEAMTSIMNYLCLRYVLSLSLLIICSVLMVAFVF